jgi:hypothetical protein
MPHNEQLLQLLKDQEYNECLQLLKEKPCEDFAALVLESKVYEKGSLRKAFWDSALVNHTISLLLKSEDCMALLHPYFSFSTPTNPKLLLKIWKQDSELFITLFKRFQRFQHNTWIEAIENMSTSIVPSKQLAVENLIQEFIKIQTLENSITVEREADFQSLQKIPIDKVLIGFCFAHGAMMENQEINGNNTRKKELDMAIVTTLDLFLKHLKEHHLIHSLSFNDNQTLQKEWAHFRPKHKSETKKAITYKNDPIYSKIQRIIDQDIDRQSKRYYISAYTAEMCLPNGSNFLYAKYNDKHSSFKKDDSKSGYEELYFSMNAQATAAGMKEGQFDLLSVAKLPKFSFIEQATMTQISNLEFYQIPLDVPKTNIDLKLALLHLTEFSRYKSPMSRIFHRNIDPSKKVNWEINSGEQVSVTIINKPPKSFSQLFGGNEAISVFDYKKLLKVLRTYYNQPITIIKDNLDFLICDLNDSNKLSGWLQRPFIKIDDKVFWLGRLLKDRRWDIILRSKLKEDKTYVEKSVYNTLVKKIDKSLETATGKVFKDKGFSVDIGWEFPNPSDPKKEGGDIDVIAYKDKFLFVVQIKNGGHSNAIRQASYIEDKQLMNQAAKQLDKSLYFIHNNWSTVQEKFNFNHNKSDVTIFPLIVTNVYNGDYKTFKSYDKISLFELYIIMNNAKKGLYHSSSHLFTSDQNSPSFNPEALKVLLGSNFDLWNKETVLKPSTLIKCIQSDSVWKDLERIRNFKV